MSNASASTELPTEQSDRFITTAHLVAPARKSDKLIFLDLQNRRALPPRRMPLPYVEPKYFRKLNLRDSAGLDFGTVWLCTKPVTAKIDFPQQDTPSAPFPDPQPAGNSTFPEIFDGLANVIGSQLSIMNGALLKMHQAVIDLVTSLSMTPAEAIREIKNNPDIYKLTDYMRAANAIATELGFNARSNWWPLVPHNIGNTTHPQYDPVVLPAYVNTGDVTNLYLPDPNGKGLGFPKVIPIDNYRPAAGYVIFYQDAEWDQSANDATKWCSWGFVTNFVLTLFEKDTGRMRRSRSISSSSSSYYAASSSYPRFCGTRKKQSNRKREVRAD